MQVVSIISTKGGVGKTTTAANLGGLLADAGVRVLLVDLDVQPTLSSYYELAQRAAGGIYELLAFNERDLGLIVSRTVIRRLDLILSNDLRGELGTLLLHAPDGRLRLRHLLPALAPHYDVILIDTQGAVGPLQDAAVLAADILVSPITPEILSAREFEDGTMELLDRLQPSSTMGAALGPMKAVIYRQDRTNDARDIARGIRDDFIKLKGRVTVLETVVPHAKAYKEAATLRIPVHRHERKREGPTPSAYTVMHQLAWELIPSLEGMLAESSRERETFA